MRGASAALLVLLTGCVTHNPATPPVAGRQCDAAAVQRLAGTPLTDASRAEALRRSGAASLRVIRPGDVVTMDFRYDRLNLEVSEAGAIVQARCG